MKKVLSNIKQKLVSKRSLIIGTLCVALAVGAFGITQLGGSGTSSGSETVIYSQVQPRTLQATTPLSGTLAHKDITTVSAQSPGFISSVYAKDNSVANVGDPLFAIGGRDAIAEPGSVPFFRNLVPGDVGNDVLELKQILAAAGDNPGPLDNVYNASTQTALALWQAQHNYPSATPASPTSVTVSLQQGTAYDIGSQSSTGLIIGPPAGAGPPSTPNIHGNLASFVTHTSVPTIDITGSASVSPGGNATLTITANPAPTENINIYLDISGDAVAGTDYVPVNPLVTLASGATVATLTINTLNDNAIQPNRFIDVGLAISPTGSYAIAEPSAAVITVTGSSGATTLPTVSLTSSTTYLLRGAPYVVNIGLSSAVTSPLTINLSYGGNAVAGTDYTVPAGNIVIPAGLTSTTVQIPTASSNQIEPDRVLTVSLSASTAYSIGAQSSTSVTIHDSNVPQLQIYGTATVSPGGSAILSVTANQAPVVDTQVALSLSGTAVAGTDYTTVNPVVTLKAGSTSVTITINSLFSQTLQPDKYLDVSISPSASASYTVTAPSTAVVTISGTGQNGALPFVTLSSSTTYLHMGTPYTITIGLDEALTAPLIIDLQFSGSAIQGTDYTIPPGSIIIPPGQTSIQVPIPTVTSNLVEADRTLTVSLGTSSAYQIGTPSSASVTITSSVVPTLTISSSTSLLNEGADATFTITADKAPSKDTSVNFVVSGTAQPGQDYVPLVGSVILKAGQTQVTVTFQSIQKDVVFEPTDMIIGNWPIRIGQVFVKQGNAINTGDPILSLTQPNVSVTLQASPSDFTKLQVGQSCTMTIAGGQNQLSGTITELDTNPTLLSSGGSGQSQQQVFEGQIAVSDLTAGATNADGASVAITVVTQQATNVTSVPIAAVKQNGTGNDVVRVIQLGKRGNSGKVEEVPVTTGLTEGSYIQITGGVHNGQVVVVTVNSKQ